MRGPAKKLVGGIPLLGAIALIGSQAMAAWACVPQPLISIEPRASGPTGTRVTVRGLAIQGPVEIRWSSVDGPRLALATGPDFAVPVTIPDSVNGLYSIMVFVRLPDGSVGSSGQAAFLVTSSSDSQGPAQPPRSTPPSAAQRTESRSSGNVSGRIVAEAVAFVLLATLGGIALSRRRRQPGFHD